MTPSTLKSQRIRTAALAAVVALGVIVGDPFPDHAQAHPYHETGWDCGEKIDIDFVGTWSQTRKNKVKPALDEWEQVLTKNGNKLVNIQVTPDPGWADTVIELRWDASGSFYGEASCPDEVIRIWEFYDDDQYGNALADVARHEMGHIFNIHHTGDGDSYGATGEEASMSTCGPGSTYTDRVFGQDDVGAAQRWRSSGNQPAMSANKSFEWPVGLKFWGVKGGGLSVIDDSSEAPVGDHYAEWTPSAANKYVYQTTNYANSDGRDIDVSLRFKKKLSLGSGDIEVRLYKKWVSYGVNPPLGCLYATGRDQNNRTAQQASFTKVQGSVNSWSATTSWQQKNSPDVEIDLDAGQHAWDIQLRIYSDVQFDGTYLDVRLDQVLLRDA